MEKVIVEELWKRTGADFNPDCPSAIASMAGASPSTWLRTSLLAENRRNIRELARSYKSRFS
jgi:hypothetical protein